ncbi:MAG: hypothetical protein Q8Q92_01440 [bacterium]|nr:hypothetical protein [bacterium]
MHNHDEKGGSWMMWAMMICCVLPILFLLFVFGLGGKGLGVSKWVTLGGIAMMVVVHLFIMGKSHKHENKSKDSKDNETHSGHGCCH